SLLFVFQNLGYQPNNLDDSWVAPLLSNRSQKVRFWCVKTLGKTKREEHIPLLKNVALKDEATEVRREAVSSIGRLRSPAIVSVLSEILTDDDPKIVLQAIRGLLTFKDDASVSKQLKSFRNHPNEMIQKVIKKEYYSSASNTLPKQAHKVSYDFLKNVIVLGDVRKVLEAVPDESFHLTFTSPPYYNARDYSIYKSYQEYLDLLKEVFELTHQKTKEGRFLIVNTSPIIIPRVSRQHSSKRYPIPFDVHNFLVNMGWEFIDDIVWKKPETSVKNRNAGFLQHRKPLAYKPNAVTEYLMVYRKETDRLIDWNMRQYDKETVEESKVEDGYETSNVWEIAPKHDKVHSAVFPVELCRRVVKYYSFKGDLVFDPFAGSGTFGKVAESLNRFFFLTEQELEYFDYMKINFAEADVFEDTKIAPNFLTLDQFREREK
ncbi:MAG: restriction endonuclease subunit M, partial [Gemmatimonadetes bacterium]|nr:restriction endonuclease subunit M [Gemmatimonadota bacterium]